MKRNRRPNGRFVSPTRAPMAYVRKLQVLAGDLGMTYSQIGLFLDVHSRTVAGWFNGNSMPWSEAQKLTVVLRDRAKHQKQHAEYVLATLRDMTSGTKNNI